MGAMIIYDMKGHGNNRKMFICAYSTAALFFTDQTTLFTLGFDSRVCRCEQKLEKARCTSRRVRKMKISPP